MTARKINPGILYAIATYAIWGLLPVFLKFLKPLPAADILSWRIVWTLGFIGALSIVLRHGAALRRIVTSRRLMLALTASSVLIGVNWLTYTIAVIDGHLAQASLGYFTNPLVNVLLGTLVLRERLGRVEGVAVVLAACGVAFLAYEQGGVPVIPLTLAFSFGFYGLIRKVTPVDALDGLLVETAILAPIAGAWLILAGTSLAAGPHPVLLPLSGVLTAIPLLLFAAAAKRVRYSDLGLIQYFSPTIQLVLAVGVYHEAIAPGQWAAFGLIWVALAIYAAGATLSSRRAAVTLPD